MSSHFQKLTELCSLLFQLTDLNVTLMDPDCRRLRFFSLNRHLYTDEDFLALYNRELLQHLGNAEHGSWYVHLFPARHVLFLDIRVQPAPGELYYVSVGPVMTTVYSDQLIEEQVRIHNATPSQRTNYNHVYSTLRPYTTRVQMELSICRFLLTSLPDLHEMDLKLAAAQPTLPEKESLLCFTSEIDFEQQSKRLSAENALRAAVASGDTCAAQKAYWDLSAVLFPAKAPIESLVIAQRCLHLTNALARTAALDGGAAFHKTAAAYEHFESQISATDDTLFAGKLADYLLQTYCDLVIENRITGYSPLIRSAIQYLYANYAQPLSLPKVACAIFCSTGHLSRQFQKETGKPLGHYLNELRIQRAVTLLESSSISITEIADMVGFNSYAKFSVEFKKYTGQTATLYRTKHSALPPLAQK